MVQVATLVDSSFGTLGNIDNLAIENLAPIITKARAEQPDPNRWLVWTCILSRTLVNWFAKQKA